MRPAFIRRAFFFRNKDRYDQANAHSFLYLSSKARRFIEAPRPAIGRKSHSTFYVAWTDNSLDG